jgi:hypothetical protein
MPIERGESTKVKIKILASIITPRGEIKPGEIIEVKPKTASRWIEQGLAAKTRAKVTKS